MIHFNLGLSSYFNNKIAKAVAELEKASELFRKDNNDKKVKITEDIIAIFTKDK